MPYSTREDLFEANVSRLLVLLRTKPAVMSLLKKNGTLEILDKVEGYFEDQR